MADLIVPEIDLGTVPSPETVPKLFLFPVPTETISSLRTLALAAAPAAAEVLRHLRLLPCLYHMAEF